MTHDFIWQRVEVTEATKLKLIGAKIKNLRDDRGSWPLKGNLELDGLAYEGLVLHEPQNEENFERNKLGDELPFIARDRVRWIMLQRPDRCAEPQPWMQLRDLLEKKGDRRGAKHVVYSFRCLEARGNGLVLKRMQIAFAWLEEAPVRILWFIGSTLLLFAAIFWNAGARGALAPTEKDAYEAFTSGKPMPASYPLLNPPIYTLENALPLVKLGQDDKWAPDRRYPSKNWLTNYWFLMWARWVLQMWGWFQAGILGAALVSRFKP